MDHFRAAVFSVCVLFALAGCGGKGHDSATPVISSDVHESASPSPVSPSPSPATPDSTNKSGYVWADQPAVASYTPSHNYQYDSLGGQIHVQRAAVGTYAVTFDRIGITGGVAHATSYGANSNFCNVVNWHPAGTDEVVEVKCFAAAGALVDSQFLANFAAGHSGLTRFSYLWADQPTTASYSPNAAYRYDSTGGKATVKRVSPGRYQVFLPASVDLGDVEPYALQVTAYGSVPAHCKISATYVASATQQVDCLNTTAAFVDTQFVVTFAAQGSFIGRDDRRYGEYNDVSTGVVINSGGVYTVPAAEMGQPKGQAIAFSEGGDFTYCHTGNWAASGTTLNTVVRCFTFNGSPFESGFRLIVTW